MDDLAMPVEAEFTLLRQELIRYKRRGERRYRCPIAMIARVSVDATGDETTALVLDLSATGLGLQLTRTFDVGTPVTLRLVGSENQQVYRVPSTVVHSTALAAQTWRIGCEFSEKLAPDAVEELL